MQQPDDSLKNHCICDFAVRLRVMRITDATIENA